MVEGACRLVSSKGACECGHLGRFQAVDDQGAKILLVGGRGGQRRHRAPMGNPSIWPPSSTGGLAAAQAESSLVVSGRGVANRLGI